MRFLKTNTAVIVTVGPFYDKTDGVTIENALTATNERITLTVDLDDGNAPTLVLDNITGAASGTANDIVVITNADAGLYQIELAAANVNYLGRAMLTITDAANHVPVFHEFMIVSAQFYAFMCGATIPDVNVTKVNGTSQTAGDLKASITTVTDDVAAVHVHAQTIIDNVAVVDGIADDILVDTAVIGALGAGLTALATQASVNVIDGIVDDILVDTGATLDAKIDGIDTVVDALAAALALVHTDVDAILLDTGTTLDGKITVVDGKADTISTAVVTTIPAAVAVVDGIVDNILVDTNELQTMLTPDGTLDVILDSIKGTVDGLGTIDPAAIADAVWDEALAGHVAAGSAGKGVQDSASAGDPWSTPIPGAYASGTAGKKVSDMVAEVTAILVDTGTTLDGKVDAVKADTDAILVDTGTTLDGKITVIDGIVDDILVDTGTSIPATLAGLGITTPPTAAAIADAVWDEVVTSGHAVGNSAAVKLTAAAAGLATAQAGLGAIANVVTVTVLDVPLQGCDVWVTSDEAGTTVVAGTLQTNASGKVTFYLDAGTYYVWQQKTGYNFTNPDTLVVT